MTATDRKRRARARVSLEDLMPHKASDVALAEARALIADRARWPGEVLIGAGATWLREGAMAEMTERRVETDEAVAGVRAAILPMGILDAIEASRQMSAYVTAAADALRALGQADAAQALTAENFAPADDPEFAAAFSQFLDMAKARVKVERPDAPPWLGRAWTVAEVVAGFAAPTDEELDEMGAIALDGLLQNIEVAQMATETRISWLRGYDYTPAPTGAYDSDPPGAGILWAVIQASAALARVHSTATQALGRAALPSEWNEATVSRRLFRVLAVRRAALASDMMTRKPPVRLLDGLVP